METLVSHLSFPTPLPSPSLLPSDLTSITDTLDAIDRDACALVTTLDEAQFNWQPDHRQWSIAQCLDHLTRCNSVYLDALRTGAALARTRDLIRRGPIQPGFFSRLFIKSMGPKANWKLPTPSVAVPAASDLRKDDVLPAFLRIQEDVRAFAQACADLDLNRARFVSPFAKGLRFSVGTGLLVIAAHDQRHLSQAHRVREASAFPA